MGVQDTFAGHFNFGSLGIKDAFFRHFNVESMGLPTGISKSGRWVFMIRSHHIDPHEEIAGSGGAQADRNSAARGWLFRPLGSWSCGQRVEHRDAHPVVERVVVRKAGQAGGYVRAIR